MTKHAAALFGVLCLANSALAVPMRVQVQSAQVRGTPSFLGQVIATVTYGQTVETLVAQGPWQQVRTTAGSTGWMPMSALTTRQIGMSTGGPNVDTGASADEMTLAGKGFGPDVEAQFRATHAGLDYTWVDKMGRFNVPRQEILRFVQAGGLKQPGGAK
jgi:hypothetical protein